MKAKVAVVDYGLGNLFSVQQACAHAGMEAAITSSRQEVLAADAVFLPGIGAFRDAMRNLQRLDLVEPLRDVAGSGKPLVGICLGLQLLMTESHEFGRHRGLGLIEGEVVRFEDPRAEWGPEGSRAARRLKVPQIGWNRIERPSAASWAGTGLEGVPDGAYMYFVHSFHATPRDPRVVLSTSDYGGIVFPSTLRYSNVFACQYHPERSGALGLSVYRNVARLIQGPKTERRGA